MKILCGGRIRGYCIVHTLLAADKMCTTWQVYINPAYLVTLIDVSDTSQYTCANIMLVLTNTTTALCMDIKFLGNSFELTE